MSPFRICPQTSNTAASNSRSGPAATRITQIGHQGVPTQPAEIELSCRVGTAAASKEFLEEYRANENWQCPSGCSSRSGEKTYGALRRPVVELASSQARRLRMLPVASAIEESAAP